MRLWSIHPKYLNSKGLVALWRESLLAKNVLEGKTKGYRNHPQLLRFKNAASSADAIHYYLEEIHKESAGRDYSFDRKKFTANLKPDKIPVTSEQISYEFMHLRQKLERRDPKKLKELLKVKKIDPHPLFTVIKGPLEEWEKISP